MLNEIIAKNMIENYLNKNCIGEYYIVSIKSRLEQMDYEFKIFERNCYMKSGGFGLSGKDIYFDIHDIQPLIHHHLHNCLMLI